MEFCTCGAKTVEGAQFCHKCGRPLYELIQPDPVEEVPVRAVEPPPAAAVSTEINFRNAIAVRVGFIVAGIGLLLNNVAALVPAPPLQFLIFIGMSIASGVLAVWLYQRRTGQHLSVPSGARLGWITGVFSFVIVVVLKTVEMAIGGPEQITKVFREAAASRAPSEEISQLLSNPAIIGIALILSLCLIFATYTVSTSVGGALGAKMLDKGSKAA